MESFSRIVKKADVPEELLKYVREDMRANRITSDWSEVVGWGPCKLYARKQGAVVRYKKSHYGMYHCCRQDRVLMAGYATKGDFQDMPIWAGRLWAKIKAANPEVTFKNFERESLTLVTVQLIDKDGDTWSVGLHKDQLESSGDDFVMTYPDMWLPSWSKISQAA